MNHPLVLGPVFIPLAGAVFALLLARVNRVQRYVALLAAALMMLSSFGVLWLNLTGGPQVYLLGGWPVSFGLSLAPDLLSALFGVMASTVLFAGVLYAVSCRDHSITFPAFMPLFLTMSAGLNGALYTGDVFNLFVFLELMVVSSVAMVAVSDNRLGLEAAIKYLFISTIGTLALLIGIAALYASFGTLNLADIAALLATGDRPLLAQAAALMLMTAFLVKGAVFPFHFWQPDFHTTAPTPISATLSSVVVKVGVYGLIRLTTLLFTVEAPLIRTLLIVLGIIGVFFGGLGALRTYDAKRMLAYSTFGQIGFILVGIGWGTPLALAAAIIYAFNHALIKAAMLMLTGAVASRTMPKTARLAELGGVGYSMKGISLLYLLGGLALAGVPPLNGFISKLALVQAGVADGRWLGLGLAVGRGLITLLYVTRAWQHIFQRKPGEDTPVEVKPYGDSPLAPALLIVLSVVLGLYAAPLIDVSLLAVEQITNPAIYIGAVLGGG